MKIGLKPCPFCGSKQVDLAETGDVTTKANKTVTCRDCEATNVGFLTYEDATEWWNRRET